MNLHDIKVFITDFIENSGFPVSDWDVDAWADEARDYMREHGLDDCEQIDADDWTRMAQGNDRTVA
ncbi:hypothetical protein [Bifidobacterium platyrrhinorum]|uniref:Uncharacterized protein n=1 Tax=Bifidobacterium platyrrhinorum TaxID=2661628 RepID=A0A6L9SSB9_9BIFI|nr:hypothetical protein [Bifidobacterium platyrrhinorum]NEG55450.1 hypothetical protein [Bifidobacterium platyrrhinorum]